MNLATTNPSDALERPKAVQSVARGLSADEVRRLEGDADRTWRDAAAAIGVYMKGRHAICSPR